MASKIIRRWGDGTLSVNKGNPQWAAMSGRLGITQWRGALVLWSARQRRRWYASGSVMSGRDGQRKESAEAPEVPPSRTSCRRFEKVKRIFEPACDTSSTTRLEYSERSGMSPFCIGVGMCQGVSVPAQLARAFFSDTISSFPRFFLSREASASSLFSSIPGNVAFYTRSPRHISGLHKLSAQLHETHTSSGPLNELADKASHAVCGYSSLSVSRKSEGSLEATGGETIEASAVGLGLPKSKGGLKGEGGTGTRQAEHEEQSSSPFSSFSDDLGTSRAWVLDSGEIDPMAFSDVKLCKDFSFPALPELLERLKEQRQSLVLEWQDRAVASTQYKVHKKDGDPSSSPENFSAPSLTAYKIRVEKETQAELQRRMHVLDLLVKDLEENWEDQLAFLSSSDVVACTIKVAADIAAQGAKTPEDLTKFKNEDKRNKEEGKEDNIPLGKKVEGAASGETELACEHETKGSDDFLTRGLDGEKERSLRACLERQWGLCVERLKQLALDEEESFIVFCILCILNRTDAELLPQLVERLEAAYFSTQGLSKRLFHPLLEVWGETPRCNNLVALVNCLPLAAKARLVHMDQWAHECGDSVGEWRAASKIAEPVTLPNWQTMQPVDMEAWEKKQRRPLKTRYVQAKPIRQWDGRKLSATLALHGRQAISRDASLQSLVAVAAICGSPVRRAFRGTLLSETLNVLAAELLRRPADSLSAGVLALTTTLSYTPPFPAKKDLFAHLAASTRLWISRGLVASGDGDVTLTPSDAEQGAGLNPGEETPQAKQNKEHGHREDGSLWRERQLRERSLREQIAFLPVGIPVVGQIDNAEPAVDASRLEASLLLRLLVNFLSADAYEVPYDFFRCLSRRAAAALAKCRSRGQTSHLAEPRTAVFSVRELSSVFDGLSVSGWQDLTLEKELLLALLQALRQDGGALSSSFSAPALSVEACRSFYSKEGVQSSSSLALVVHGLACMGSAPSTPHALSHSGDKGRSGAFSRVPPEFPEKTRPGGRTSTAAEAYDNDSEDPGELRDKVMTASWALLEPVLDELCPETK
ncbi:hypothetical protein CSUI_004566 [Cystoisospora suis]|uniref:Uncharacterized protein n=1 Tax=Cystoisospora suis TaxID=483139 RepID=A0A2C6KYA4_9APIC|nr:hypothetical protein CSUI_004566 [Cystoisospora suis]